jgi:hypothetical protein
MPLHNIVYWVFATCCCAYAAYYGERPERWGAAINIVASLLSVAASTAPSTRWVRLQYGVAAIDILVFASFLLIAIVARRTWAIWASGFLLAELWIHAVRLLSAVPRWIYAALVVVWAYPALAALAIGTWQVHRRRTKARSSIG